MNDKSKSFSIKTWKEDDQPREKLIKKGKASLSDAELIAILLGSGSRDESAVDLAKKILKFTGNNLNALAKLTVEQLMQFKGIGEAKSVSIVTALELGLRRRLEEALDIPKITSSRDVFEIMHSIIGTLQHEEFWVLFMNNSNKIIHKIQLSKGGITGTLVDIRIIMKKAIELSSTALILTHNHPSGTLKPSNADIQLTQKVKKAGETLDIKVLDHIIITEKAYFSFADSQIL